MNIIFWLSEDLLSVHIWKDFKVYVWYLTTHFQLWQRSIITKQVRLVLIKEELMFPAHVIRDWLSRTWGIVREWDPHLLFMLKFLVLLQAMTLEQTQWELIKCFKPHRLASEPHQQTLPKQSLDALRILYTSFSLG